MVVMISDMVVAGEGVPNISFLCGFCRRDVDESLHVDGFSNIHSWRSRSELENNSCEILKNFNLGRKKKGRLFLMWKNIGVQKSCCIFL